GLTRPQPNPCPEHSWFALVSWRSSGALPPSRPWLSRCNQAIGYGGLPPVLSRRRALSSPFASNELMKRCVVRQQAERRLPMCWVLGHLCHECALHERTKLLRWPETAFTS